MTTEVQEVEKPSEGQEVQADEQGLEGNFAFFNKRSNLTKISTMISDLETSLRALESLDRSSPDLWPDHSKFYEDYYSYCLI